MQRPFSLRTTLAVALLLASGAALAQQNPARTRPGATPGGTHASNVRESTTIQRNTNRVASVGEFPTENAPPPPPLPPGEVGSTGLVAERRPDSELRGSTGPAPGEIDMTRPIGAADVARILRAYEPRLRPCYDRARAAHPTLAGRVNMRFVVDRNGSLNNVDVTGMPEAPDVATCIRTELQQTHFPRPESGTLPFASGMNFSPPAAPPRGRRPAPHRAH